MNLVFLRSMILSTCLLCMFGCGPKGSIPGLVPASGTLTLDGTPVEGATISFLPVSQTADAVTVGTVSEAGGVFKLGYRQYGEGTLPGEYQVTVQKITILNPISIEEATKLSEAGKDHVQQIQHDIPVKFNTPKTSGITITIPPKGDANILLDLKSK